MLSDSRRSLSPKETPEPEQPPSPKKASEPEKPLRSQRRRYQPKQALRPGASHKPWLAAFASLLLPGMGQAYNGQRDRALSIALSAPLILPWIFGIFDAWVSARAILAGKERSPGPETRTLLFAQLALNLSLLFGIAMGAFIWSRLQIPSLEEKTQVPILFEKDVDLPKSVEEFEEMAPDAQKEISSDIWTEAQPKLQPEIQDKEEPDTGFDFKNVSR